MLESACKSRNVPKNTPARWPTGIAFSKKIQLGKFGVRKASLLTNRVGTATHSPRPLISLTLNKKRPILRPDLPRCRGVCHLTLFLRNNKHQPRKGTPAQTCNSDGNSTSERAIKRGIKSSFEDWRRLG